MAVSRQRKRGKRRQPSTPIKLPPLDVPPPPPRRIALLSWHKPPLAPREEMAQ